MYPARRVLANGAHAVTSGTSNASEGDAEHADRGWLEAVPHIAFMGSLQRVDLEVGGRSLWLRGA